MKTIKMTRTVRREVDGMFVYIGPKGIAFRQKHSKRAFPLSWKQVWNQAMLAAVAEEQQKRRPGRRGPAGACRPHAGAAVLRLPHGQLRRA